MPRIPDTELDRLKSEVSLERLIEGCLLYTSRCV